MIAEELNIQSDAIVPLVILNDAPVQTKEFQIQSDVMVPYADIYDDVIPPRRRVMEF